MTAETYTSGSCSECGTPAHIGCEHTKQSPEVKLEGESKLTREYLASRDCLEIKIKADFGPTLEALRISTGADLQPRPDGYHITIVGLTENKILSTLSDEQSAELQHINEQIQQGNRVFVNGIGFIDGASPAHSMREVDKVKKTAFVALDIPALQEFRTKIGLPPKDFHVTLGFVNGDIHTQIMGQEPQKPGSPIRVRGP